MSNSALRILHFVSTYKKRESACPTDLEHAECLFCITLRLRVEGRYFIVNATTVVTSYVCDSSSESVLF